MARDLQKANLWKRISAAFFDGMMQCMIALGLAIVLTVTLGFSGYIAQLSDVYEKYETSYGVDFDISSAQYEMMTAEEQETYQDAVAALEQDEKAIRTYNMLVSMALLIVTLSILVAVLIWEFVLPLVFGNGQTLGKKIFGIAVMRIEGIKVSTMSVFVRAILGKFTIEWMLPIYIILLILLNSIGVVGFVILLLLLVVQIVCLASTRVGALLHDVFASTVVVDFASQRIFDSKEELLEYTKKLHAEKAAEAEY